MSQIQAPPAPARAVPLAVTFVILGISSLTVMANATIAPSLPGLQAHFADTPGIETLAGLVLTLPSLFVVLTAGMIGVLADRLNRRPLIVASMVLYALGGLTGLLADTMTGMLAGRVVLGLGVAGTMTLATAYAGTLWHGAARERFIGLQVAAMNMGGIVFMITGGVLAGMSWRAPFGIYMVALPLALAAWFVLSRVPGRASDGAPDPAQGSAGEPQSFPWLIYAWVGGMAFLLMSTFYTLPVKLPFVLRELGVENPAYVGMILAGVTLASIPGALGYGFIRRFADPRAIMSVGFITLGLGIIIVATAQSLPMVVLGVLVTGASLGPNFPNFMAFFMAKVPPALRGRASGLMTMAIFGGQFVSPLVAAPLIAAYGLHGGILLVGCLPVAAGLAVGVLTLGHRVLRPAGV